jgi:cell division protease FtsH
LGLSEKMGNISFYDSTGIYENSFLKPFSEETAKLIDSEVRSLISEAETKTFQILTENRAKLDELVELLIEKEVLYKEDIQKILGNREEPMGEVN